jgi:heme-degrading monooxygenase HmoA
MHVTVTTTKGTPGQPLEVATLAGEAMLPWLAQIEGFEGLLMMSNERDGTTLVITFWESKEVADEHRAARAEFRDRITATVDVRVESVADYDLTFADLGSWPADTTV